jgi:hypothetical protein
MLHPLQGLNWVLVLPLVCTGGYSHFATSSTFWKDRQFTGKQLKARK